MENALGNGFVYKVLKLNRDTQLLNGKTKYQGLQKQNKQVILKLHKKRKNHTHMCVCVYLCVCDGSQTTTVTTTTRT